jgi:hypothetical protein
MTHWTSPKAVLAGLSVFVLGQAMYYCFVHHELLRLVLLGTPSFAAFVAAYLAPNRKIAIGMSMAVYGAIIGQLMAIGYEYLGGYVDHIGGVLETFVILLSYYLVLSLIGSVVGYFLSRKDYYE